MDFLGLILKGIVMLLVLMGMFYIAFSNPGTVTAIAVVMLTGSVLFLVRGN